MDSTELFIEEVRKNEFLYDLQNKDYKNVHKKKVVWEKLGKAFNSSGESCRKRWKGLRDTYKRYKRLDELAAGSGAVGTKKKWKYWDLMSFLDECADIRPTPEVFCSENDSTLDSDEDTLDSSELASRFSMDIKESPITDPFLFIPSSETSSYETNSTTKSTKARVRGQKVETVEIENTLSEFPPDNVAYFEKHFFIEQEKIELEKKKLSLDTERLNKDFILRKLELEHKERLDNEKLRKEYELKKLELEQKERLSMLELKYKYNQE